MANTQGMARSFKRELLNGEHQFGAPTLVSRGSLTAPTADTFKAALYFASSTINDTNTVYTTTGEATGTNYTAGGITVPNATAPSLDTATAIWTPSASLTWNTLTMAAFDAMMLYNSTQSNKAVAVFTFGSQTVTAGNFSLTMPSNVAATALIRIA